MFRIFVKLSGPGETVPRFVEWTSRARTESGARTAALRRHKNDLDFAPYNSATIVSCVPLTSLARRVQYMIAVPETRSFHGPFDKYPDARDWAHAVYGPSGERVQWDLLHYCDPHKAAQEPSG